MKDIVAEKTYYYTHDGNGNVQQLVDSATGDVVADYGYGPFGEPLRTTGAMAALNPFRFSTKYQDEETGLIYYGFRYYHSQTGRWLNRDPINQMGDLRFGDVTLLSSHKDYLFVENSPSNRLDVLGLADRLEIAQQIVDWEARRNRNGDLIAYILPANDGGGSFEIAGLNDRYHEPIARNLSI